MYIWFFSVFLSGSYWDENMKWVALKSWPCSDTSYLPPLKMYLNLSPSSIPLNPQSQGRWHSHPYPFTHPIPSLSSNFQIHLHPARHCQLFLLLRTSEITHYPNFSCLSSHLSGNCSVSLACSSSFSSIFILLLFRSQSPTFLTTCFPE